MAQDNTLTRGERTQQAILSAAESLFLTNGYNGTSMRQIAQEAGDIAVGGIYNHFEGKEDIFRGLLEARSPYQEIIITLAQLDAANGREMLSEAFISLQAIIEDHIQFFGLVLIDIQEFEGRTIRQLIGTIIPPVMQFGQRLRESGVVQDEIEYLLMMRLFASVLIGYTVTNLVAYTNKGEMALPDAPELPREYWQENIIDLLLNGLAPA